MLPAETSSFSKGIAKVRHGFVGHFFRKSSPVAPLPCDWYRDDLELVRHIVHQVDRRGGVRRVEGELREELAVRRERLLTIYAKVHDTSDGDRS
jgi:hypothetical protein